MRPLTLMVTLAVLLLALPLLAWGNYVTGNGPQFDEDAKAQSARALPTPVKTAEVAPEQPDPWDLHLKAELGAGVTWAQKQKYAAFLGLRIGQIPPKMPLFGGMEFGGDFAYMEGGDIAGGLWLGIVELGDFPVRAGVLVWQPEDASSLKYDLSVRLAYPFEVSW